MIPKSLPSYLLIMKTAIPTPQFCLRRLQRPYHDYHPHLPPGLCFLYPRVLLLKGSSKIIPRDFTKEQRLVPALTMLAFRRTLRLSELKFRRNPQPTSRLFLHLHYQTSSNSSALDRPQPEKEQLFSFANGEFSESVTIHPGPTRTISLFPDIVSP